MRRLFRGPLKGTSIKRMKVEDESTEEFEDSADYLSFNPDYLLHQTLPKYGGFRISEPSPPTSSEMLLRPSWGLAPPLFDQEPIISKPQELPVPVPPDPSLPELIQKLDQMVPSNSDQILPKDQPESESSEKTPLPQPLGDFSRTIPNGTQFYIKHMERDSFRKAFQNIVFVLALLLFSWWLGVEWLFRISIILLPFFAVVPVFIFLRPLLGQYSPPIHYIVHYELIVGLLALGTMIKMSGGFNSPFVAIFSLFPVNYYNRTHDIDGGVFWMLVCWKFFFEILWMDEDSNFYSDLLLLFTYGAITFDAAQLRSISALTFDILSKLIAGSAKTCFENSRFRDQTLSHLGASLLAPASTLAQAVDSLPNDSSQLTEMLRESTESCLGTIIHLGDYCDILSSTFSLKPRPIELISLFDDLMHSFSLAVSHNSTVEVIAVFPTKLKELHLILDPRRFCQILANLMSNSIKFTEKGFVVINFQIVSQNSSFVTLEFVISDTGIGISESVLQRILEPIDIRSPRYSGLGLGFAISRLLVGKMNGQLKLNSAVGFGTKITLSFQFPLTNILFQNSILKFEKKILCLLCDPKSVYPQYFLQLSTDFEIHHLRMHEPIPDKNIDLLFFVIDSAFEMTFPLLQDLHSQTKFSHLALLSHSRQNLFGEKDSTPVLFLKKPLVINHLLSQKLLHFLSFLK